MFCAFLSSLSSLACVLGDAGRAVALVSSLSPWSLASLCCLFSSACRACSSAVLPELELLSFLVKSDLPAPPAGAGESGSDLRLPCEPEPEPAPGSADACGERLSSLALACGRLRSDLLNPLELAPASVAGAGPAALGGGGGTISGNLALCERARSRAFIAATCAAVGGAGRSRCSRSSRRSLGSFGALPPPAGGGAMANTGLILIVRQLKNAMARWTAQSG
jgi:hypothetical protein